MRAHTCKYNVNRNCHEIVDPFCNWRYHKPIFMPPHIQMISNTKLTEEMCEKMLMSQKGRRRRKIMAKLTVNYETLVRSLTEDPNEEDCRDNQAVVASHLDRYLDYVQGVVEGAGHEVEINYGQEWGPSLTVGSDVSHDDEMDLRLFAETIPPFLEWYN